MRREAFTDAYAGAAPALYAWARLRVKPALRKRLDPEDLVQEVCCRAYQGFDRFDPARGPFRGWLFGIGNRVLQGLLLELGRDPRAASQRGPGPGDDALAAVPDEATSISRRAARDERLAAFCEWVDGFDPDERGILVHRGLERRSHEEVAALLGLSEEVVKKRWQRLLARLRERGLPATLGLEP